MDLLGGFNSAEVRSCIQLHTFLAKSLDLCLSLDSVKSSSKYETRTPARCVDGYRVRNLRKPSGGCEKLTPQPALVDSVVAPMNEAPRTGAGRNQLPCFASSLADR